MPNLPRPSVFFPPAVGFFDACGSFFLLFFFLWPSEDLEEEEGELVRDVRSFALASAPVAAPAPAEVRYTPRRGVAAPGRSAFRQRALQRVPY